MKRYFLALTALALASCSALPGAAPSPAPTPWPITPTFFATPSPTPPPVPIYLNLIWTFHQPAQAIDEQTGLYARPTVRLQALQRYAAAAAVQQKYPTLKTVFSFSPILLSQLAGVASGARDRYWELAARESAGLTAEDKRFVVLHFGDFVAPGVVDAYPRYRALLDQRSSPNNTAGDSIQNYTEQDIRDLQTWSILSQFPPDLLAAEPWQGLVAKSRDYSEEDKQVVLLKMTEVIQSVLPAFRRLQDQGTIEIITSAYAQPILPLLMDDAAWRSARTSQSASTARFSYPIDGAEQLTRAVAVYTQQFGQAPRGMWPASAAISRGVLEPARSAGFQWVASAQGVLAASLGGQSSSGFARDAAGVPDRADDLYQPYDVSGGLPLFFADTYLSDRAMAQQASQPESAAQTLADAVLSIRDRLLRDSASVPGIVTLVLNGERADPSFMDALYHRLSAASESGVVRSITPSEYLAQVADRRTLSDLVPGAWSGPGLENWFNTPEHVLTWQYVNQTREFLDGYFSNQKMADHAGVARAYDAMLQAEGEDWFNDSSAGSGIDSGAGKDAGASQADREYADQTFRGLLAQVYRQVGAPVPDFIKVPVLPPVVIEAERPSRGPITPTLAGSADSADWENAALVRIPAAGPDAPQLIDAVMVGRNATHLFIRVKASQTWDSPSPSGQPPAAWRVGIYLRLPDSPAVSRFTRVNVEGDPRAALGFDATHLVEWTLDPGGAASAMLYTANDNQGWSPLAEIENDALGDLLDLSVPIHSLGGVKPGSSILLVVAAHQADRIIGIAPRGGVVQITVQ